MGFNYQEEVGWDSIIKRRWVGIQLSRRGGLGFNYQEEVGWDSIIKRRWVGIQLSRGGGLGFNYQEVVGWDSIYLSKVCAQPKPGPGIQTSYVVVFLTLLS